MKAFGDLKASLKEGLEVFQLNPDRPFLLKTDASGWAIGAVLEQEKDGVWLPVAFHSRKLAKSQGNWTPREKQTYAIVAALKNGRGGFVFNLLWSKLTIGH